MRETPANNGEGNSFSTFDQMPTIRFIKFFHLPYVYTRLKHAICDDFKGFLKIEGITLCGCWAHLPINFFKKKAKKA